MSDVLKAWVTKLAERNGTVLHLVPGRLPLGRVGGRLEPLEERMVDDRTFVEVLHAVCGDGAAGVIHTGAGGGQLLHGRVVQDAGRRTLVIRRLVTPETGRATLGLPDIVWDTVAGLKGGLILVAGEHDGGTSTTCAALTASRIEDAGVSVLITGEPLFWRLPSSDPRTRIRHAIGGVDTEADFVSEAVGEALMGDTDLICCDPVRGPYTAELLSEAATNGRLVVAGINADSAAGALAAWTDQHGEDRHRTLSLTARALQLVVHQALVERADGNGRVLASGVLLRTPAVHNLIREDRAHQLPAMMAVGSKLGMRTLEQHLQQLVAEGTVTREAAEAAHPQPWVLRDWLDRSAPKAPPEPQP